MVPVQIYKLKIAESEGFRLFNENRGVVVPSVKVTVVPFSLRCIVKVTAVP